MRVVPKFGEHAHIGRALADKTIEVREPQLIKLPIPLPSIPLLTPLLAPVIGGTNKQDSDTTTSASTPTPTPSSTPSTGDGGGQGDSGGNSGGDNNNGNGNGSGSSGDGSGDGDGGSNDGSGAGQSGSSSGNNPSGGSTNNNPTSSSNQSAPSKTSSGSNSTPTAKSTSGGGTFLNSGGPGSQSNTDPGNGSDSGNSVSGEGAANAGSIPTSSSHGGASFVGSHTTGSNGNPASTYSVPGGGSDNGGNDNGGTNSNGTVSASQNEGHKHGISGGAIAGIVVCLLILLLAFLVFILRRRRKARQDERANAWWFAQKRNSKTYGDRDSKEIVMPGNRSVRSSFATTVDRSGSPIIDMDFEPIPPLPPMAEIGRANGTAPKLVIDSSNFNSAENGLLSPRFSIGSNHSDSQYLVVHHRDSVSQPGTPMSVRPFSPSESFAFPKPPDPAGDRTSAYSRPSSSGTLAIRNSIPSFNPPSSPLVPPTPALPPIVVMSPISKAIDPFADNNPFDDPSSTASNASTGEFAEIEFIRRPFYPTLPDEIAVRPDDPVRILQTFDDGWALIEKVRPDQPKGGATGLIPIDCLREAGQDLPSFFAAKRVSSYAGSDGVYTAM